MQVSREKLGVIPSEVFDREPSLRLNGSTVAADTFWNGIHPFIDHSTGGIMDGMIAASDANLATTTGNTIVIAGHGKAVVTTAELREFRDMLVAVRDKVAALKE